MGSRVTLLRGNFYKNRVPRQLEKPTPLEMTPSLHQIREQTDLLPNVIHFNNAGSSLPPRVVTEAMQDYLLRESRYGGYEVAHDYAEVLDGFYRAIATHLNCRPDQVARAESATRAFNRGILGICWKEGDVILTTKSDYISNHLVFAQLRDRSGVVTELIPEGNDGFDPKALEKRLEEGKLPRLVSITHVPTNSGRIQDVVAAGQLCRKYNVLYAVDACQSAGQLSLDVQQIQCDFLSATFRKYLRGPRGIAFLYLSDRVLQDETITPLGLDSQGADWTGPDQYRLHHNASRFETWEESKVLKIGATKAVDYLNELGIDFIQARIQLLSSKLRLGMGKVAGLEPHHVGNTALHHGTATLKSSATLTTGIHLMNVPGWTKSPAELIAQLRQHGLHATTSGVTHDQFHFREQNIDWALRLSVHYFNTEAEIDRAMEILEAVL